MTRGLLARHVAIYGASTLLVQSVSLLTAPVFTRHFGPARYGVLDVTSATVALVITVVMGGLDNAVARAYVNAASEDERRVVVSTGLAAVAGAGALVALVSVFLAGPVSDLLFGDRTHAGLVRAAAISVPLTVVAIYTRRLLRVQLRPVLSLISAVTLALVGAVAAIVLAVPAGLGLAGVYAGIALGAVAGLAVSIAATRKLLAWRFSRRVLLDLAAVGFPLALFALSLWAVRMVDRFILVRLVDLHQLGYYAVANRVAGVLLLAVLAFEGAWLPVLLRTEGTGDGRAVITRDGVLPALAAVVAGMSVLMAAFSPEILAVFAGHTFDPAARVVPPLVLAMLIHATTPVTASELIVARRTAGLAYGALGAVVVNVVACLLLVPRWGIAGAAWATVLGFAYRASDCYLRARQLLSVKERASGAHQRAGLALALAVPFLALGYVEFANGAGTLLVKGLGVAAFGAVVVRMVLARRP